MRKSYVLALIAMMCFSADVNAQGFLKGLADKAKEKVEKKVEGAVGKALGGKSKDGKSKDAKSNGKTDNGPRLKETYGKHDGYIVTATGIHDDGKDPFQVYVEELAAPASPKDWREQNREVNVEADDVAYSSIDEAIKAFPPLPTVQQMFDQDVAPVKARKNFDRGVDELETAVAMNISRATDIARKKNAGKKGVSGAQRAQMDNGAAQIFAYMQKHGIDPEKMSDKQMEELVKKGIASGEIKIGGMGGGFVVDPDYSEEQDEAINQVAAKIDAINEKLDEASRTEITYTYDALSLEKTLKPLYAEIQASWLTSEACKQVYEIEKNIDKRAWDYFEKHPDYGNNGAVLEYPDFWVQGRKQQNEIIRKFNMEQAEKWRNVLNTTYEKYLPAIKEMPAVESELEALFTDKNDLVYNNLKHKLTVALMGWNRVYQILLMRSYGAPLVSGVSEEKTIAQ